MSDLVNIIGARSLVLLDRNREVERTLLLRPMIERAKKCQPGCTSPGTLPMPNRAIA
jgi:hypothetical protein